MSVAPSPHHPPRLPRARYWPVIGAALAALFFLPAWTQAAIQVAHGADQVRLVAPLTMTFTASSLYLALFIGLVLCAFAGALVGGVAAALATLPYRRR